MSKRVHNFCAGPCTLPLSVLEEVQAELLNYHDTGSSIIEMSHRDKNYLAIHEEAQHLALKYYRADNDFTVLFLQGGAHLQFAQIPMNLLQPKDQVAHVVAGTWGKGAFTDARYYARAYTAWDGTLESFTRVPEDHELTVKENTRYLHVTSNETINGLRYVDWPDVGLPLVADMSSDYMSRPIPWEKFDLVYGGAQKNLGPAGLTVVFIRRSLLAQCNSDIGRYLNYAIQAKSGSMFNTPPVFAIYIFHKVLKWMTAQGDIDALAELARKKASLIYEVIDASSDFYHCPVVKTYRSHMNVVFNLPSPELESDFVSKAAAQGMTALKGHRSVGGIRASIYNAMSITGVQALAEFMVSFMHAERHRG